MTVQIRNDAGSSTAQKGRCLLLDPSGGAGRKCQNEERVLTPARCLERVGEGDVRAVAIVFGSGSDTRRATLLEFVSILKNNAKTGDLTVVAVVPARHRLLLEALKREGADFVFIFSESTANSFCVDDMLGGLTAKNRPEHILKEICPHLNYSAIDSRREISLCGAYRNRMVLGGSRLHNICETNEHIGCEYYLNPRPSA